MGPEQSVSLLSGLIADGAGRIKAGADTGMTGRPVFAKIIRRPTVRRRSTGPLLSGPSRTAGKVLMQPNAVPTSIGIAEP